MTGKKTDTSNIAKKASKSLQQSKANNTKENGRISENVLRRRRAQSIGRVEDETARETRFKADNPDNPLVVLHVLICFELFEFKRDPEPLLTANFPQPGAIR